MFPWFQVLMRKCPTLLLILVCDFHSKCAKNFLQRSHASSPQPTWLDYRTENCYERFIVGWVEQCNFQGGGVQFHFHQIEHNWFDVQSTDLSGEVFAFELSPWLPRPQVGIATRGDVQPITEQISGKTCFILTRQFS